jgi:hypothetical protein
VYRRILTTSATDKPTAAAKKGRKCLLELIMDERVNQETGQTEYLAKWANFGPEHATWEPAHHFEQPALDEWAKERTALKSEDDEEMDVEAEMVGGNGGDARREMGAEPKDTATGGPRHDSFRLEGSMAPEEAGAGDVRDSLSPIKAHEQARHSRTNSANTGYDGDVSHDSFATAREDLSTQADNDDDERYEPIFQKLQQKAAANTTRHLLRRKLAKSAGKWRRKFTPKTDDESSDESDVELTLPETHEVYAVKHLPAAIVTELDDMFQVIYLPHPVSGKVPRPLLLQKSAVQPELVRKWHFLKLAILDEADEKGEEFVSREYGLRQDERRISVRPDDAEMWGVWYERLVGSKAEGGGEEYEERDMEVGRGSGAGAEGGADGADSEADFTPSELEFIND